MQRTVLGKKLDPGSVEFEIVTRGRLSGFGLPGGNFLFVRRMLAMRRSYLGRGSLARDRVEVRIFRFSLFSI
jgi:hypothetical protein